MMIEDREFRSVLKTTLEIMDWKSQRTELQFERAGELLEALQHGLVAGTPR
jgi:hypothetical protein